MTQDIQAADKIPQLAEMLGMNEDYIREAELDQASLNKIFSSVARARKIEGRVMVPTGLLACALLGAPFMGNSVGLKVAGIVLGTLLGMVALTAGFIASGKRKDAMIDIESVYMARRMQPQRSPNGPISGDI